MDWNKFLLDLANACMPVIISGVVALIGAGFALLVQKIRLYEQQLQNEKPSTYEKLEKITKDAVMIAEQLKIANVIEDKKNYAIDYIQKEADKIGLKVNIEQVSDMIEKVVFEELNRFNPKKQ